jgi:hypothetical protein
VLILSWATLAHRRGPRDDDEDDRKRLVFQGIRVIARDDVVITDDEGAGGVADWGVPSTSVPFADPVSRRPRPLPR